MQPAARGRGQVAFATGYELAPVLGDFVEDGAGDGGLGGCETEGNAGADSGFEVGEPAWA